MAFKVPNHTQTPNELFDEHMKTMSGSELKIVLAICRQTFGWHKEQDRISTAQLMEMTGLSNRSVINAIRKVMARGLVARRRVDDSYEYALILTPYEKSSQGGYEKSSQGSRGRGYEKSSHTKEKKRKYPSLLKEKKDYLQDPFAHFIED